LRHTRPAQRSRRHSAVALRPKRPALTHNANLADAVPTPLRNQGRRPSRTPAPQSKPRRGTLLKILSDRPALATAHPDELLTEDRDPLTSVRAGDPDRDPLIGGVITGPPITRRDPAGRVDTRPQPKRLLRIVLAAEPLDR